MARRRVAWRSGCNHTGCRAAQGVGAADTWVSLQHWAAKAQPASNALPAAWDDISKDSELRGLLRNEGLNFTFQTLKQGLSPLLSGSFSMAKFLLNYGYDAGAWNVSRQQILQRAQQADQNLLAECKLARLIEIDVRNLNVCNHRLPDTVPSDYDRAVSEHFSRHWQEYTRQWPELRELEEVYRAYVAAYYMVRHHPGLAERILAMPAVRAPQLPPLYIYLPMGRPAAHAPA